MFFPVLLYRDYGHGSWILFTIPNIIGAASMPWVLKTAEASQAFVERYRVACTTFSWVTAAYQIFFIGWVSQFIPVALWGGAIVLGFAVAAVAMLGGRASLLAGSAVWVCSMALMGYVLGIADLETLGFPNAGVLFEMKSDGFWIIPIFLIGFAFCPYLDLTFHRARQASARPKLVFAGGFGVPFLLGLIFTLLYSHPMSKVLAGDASAVPVKLVIAVGLHQILQGSYTAAEHFRSALAGRSVRVAHWIAGLALLALAPLLPEGGLFGLSYSELTYRTFLTCYGLLAPAFVWMILVSNRAKADGASGTVAGLSPRALKVGLVAAAVAMPFYAGAFLAHNYGFTWLALPGVAVVILGGLFVPRAQTVRVPAIAEE
jgi:hypothetical protein